jgi:hypothetical protein
MSEWAAFWVFRGVFDHPLFDGDRYSRRAAWLWLIAEAAWKPCTRRIAGRRVEVGRGQLVHSMRFIARAWLWSEASVRRFLHELEAENMLKISHDAGVTQLTICKYDAYQAGPENVTQQRRRLEPNKEERDADVWRARC